MISEVFSFEDELTEECVTVIIETFHEYGAPKAKKGRNGLYFYMGTEHATYTTTAYIPRKQVKKIIKAMQEVLNDK